MLKLSRYSDSLSSYSKSFALSYLSIVWLSLASHIVLASETSELTIKSQEVQSSVKAQTPIQEDKQITDQKLKAENGSLNKYSFKASLGVYGPPVGDLANPNTPNPDGSISNSATSVSGSISARYRFDSRSSLSFGTGLNALTPFNGIQRVDVRTPTLTYDEVFRSGDWQFRSAPGISAVTIPEYINVGEVASLNYDASAFRQIGTSRFKLGTEASFGYYIYNRNYVSSDKNANRYSVGFYPAVKYSVTDSVGLFSSLNISFWNPRFKSNELVMWNKTLSQRLGVDYSFTRDIFISSYLNFYPKSLNSNSTTVNFATIFSL